MSKQFEAFIRVIGKRYNAMLDAGKAEDDAASHVAAYMKTWGNKWLQYQCEINKKRFERLFKVYGRNLTTCREGL